MGNLNKIQRKLKAKIRKVEKAETKPGDKIARKLEEKGDKLV